MGQGRFDYGWFEVGGMYEKGGESQKSLVRRRVEGR